MRSGSSRLKQMKKEPNADDGSGDTVMAYAADPLTAATDEIPSTPIGNIATESRNAQPDRDISKRVKHTNTASPASKVR